MNKQLQEYARQTLKDGLVQCTEMQQHIFRSMYGNHKENGQLVNSSESVNSVVDNIPNEKLDWAMQQVQRTIIKKMKEGDYGN